MESSPLTSERADNGLRVLHLIHHLDIGGAERLLVQLLPALKEAGIDAHAVCLNREGALFETLRATGVPCFCVRRKFKLDLRALWRLRRLLRDLRIEVLHTHEFSAGLWGCLAGAWAGTPVILRTEHAEPGWNRPLKHRIVNRFLDRFTTAIVAVSPQVKESLIARERAESGLIEVIPNGIDLSPYENLTPQPGTRRRLGLPESGPLIGMVARCSREKGGQFFLEACSLLREDGVYGVLVGDGPMLKEWRALAETMGLQDRVTFAGAQSDVTSWLSVLDVVLVPSLQESFGLSVLEAQAAGIPVVASRAGGIPEIIKHGQTGLLVPPGDTAALAAAVRELLGDKSLAQKLSRQARRAVGERFSIRACAQLHRDLYERFADSRTAAHGEGSAQ